MARRAQEAREAADEDLVALIRAGARAWTSDAPASAEAVVRMIGPADIVLLGEATHGTREFYGMRAEITRRLIAAGRCDAVLVEGDWPDAYRANRYVQGRSGDADAVGALGDFKRFPHWMWRNMEVAGFLEWLHGVNADRTIGRRIGFYGLDLYSMYSSIGAVIRYLEDVDPAAARAARKRYACFERFDQEADDPRVATGGGADCAEPAMNQLLHLLANRENYVSRDGIVAQDEQFHAEQNARLVANAEKYYRALFGGRASTWNLRDRHMADTLEAMRRHLIARGLPGRLVVWAHNSHLGDARATEMAEREEINLGQLVRERFPGESFSLGFTTHHGTVTAAEDWDEPAERMDVRPALAGSVEEILHRARLPVFMLDLRDRRLRDGLGRRLQRAIGVIYRPATERLSHYLWTEPARQFDALIHVDETSALDPLDATPKWRPGGLQPDTFPSGI